MVGGSTHKPIVFVFGTPGQKSDADTRKKNLSAINTQVAYRAHERRREKKNRQRALAKEEDKVDQKSQQRTSSLHNVDVSSSNTLSTPSAHNQNVSSIDFHHYDPFNHGGPAESRVPIPSALPRYPANAQIQPQLIHLPPALAIHPQKVIFDSGPLYHRRRSADLSSEAASEQDRIWSPSPTSNGQSTPATELSSVSPTSSSSLMADSYFQQALDPFFRTPTIASEREKWLVHFCESISEY